MSSRELERLSSIELTVLRNYFRLLEADRQLRARAHSTPKPVGMLLADTLDAERQRIGRELHTGVGQALAGIHVHVSLIRDAMPDPPARVRKSLDQITALAGTALQQVRGVSRSLYVPGWQAKRLVEALRDLWANSGVPEKFAGTVDLRELSTEPPPEIRRAIYLVAQEGISNTIQHADARRVRMSLREEAGQITFELADDGSGFREPSGTGRPTGIGLRAIRDLAGQLGGELRTDSTDEGVQLSISFPVTHE